MNPDPYRSPEKPAQAVPSIDDTLGTRRSVHPLALGTHASDILLGGALALLMNIVGALLAGWNGLGASLPLSLVGFAVVALPAIRRRGLRVELYEGGIVVAGRGARDILLFEDVDEVWYELSRVRVGMADLALFKAMRLVEHGGLVHRVPLDMEGGLDVGRAIIRRCSSPLVADAEIALAAGESLTFGPVGIDARGIMVRGARCEWSELALVRRQPWRTIFFRAQTLIPWRSVRLDRIPHPLIFARLVSSLAPRIENDDPLEKWYQ